MKKIWIISDMHDKWGELVPPKVDMVICAGDASTTRGTSINTMEMVRFMEWFSKLPINYKIFVAGNHDTSVYHRGIDMKEYPDVVYLEHESVVIDGIKIYGSPYTPDFGIGWAYNVDRERLKDYWDAIDEDTDILVTHGPPHTILDETYGGHYGDLALKNKVAIVKPTYHIFGHFHDEPGIINSMVYANDGTTYINASVVDLRHGVINNGKIIGI